MDFLLYGPDLKLRDKARADIKKEVLPADASSLDFESLDSHKLTPEKLKIALYCLPGVSQRRLVHIYRAEKLIKESMELLLSFLKTEHAHVVVVLEADQWDSGTKLRGEISQYVKMTGTNALTSVTVFDMMNAVGVGNSSAGLRALNKLFIGDEAPERLLGGMVWSWSNKIKGSIMPQAYKKGLLVLQEADIALKRGHFPNRENALELAVIRLSSLVKPLKF